MKHSLLTAAVVAGLLAAAPAMAQSARLGYVPTEDHPVGQASRYFAKLVEEKTGGRITIETFGNGVLGSEPDMQASVQAGFIDIMVGPTPNLVGVVPEFMIYDLPFFYKDFAAVDAVMDGAVGERLFSLLKEKKIGRASCRDRAENRVGRASGKAKISPKWQTARSQMQLCPK